MILREEPGVPLDALDLRFEGEKWTRSKNR